MTRGQRLFQLLSRLEKILVSGCSREEFLTNTAYLGSLETFAEQRRYLNQRVLGFRIAAYAEGKANRHSNN